MPMGILPQLYSLVTNSKKNIRCAIANDRPSANVDGKWGKLKYIQENPSRGIAPLLEEEEYKH